MKFLLIGGSNISLMPYVQNYLTILKENGCAVDVIEWDRLGEGKAAKFSYKDQKAGFQRNIFDYFKFAKYVIKILEKKEHDRIILFGIQLSYFLKNELIRNFRNKYIFDIRDYNKIINLFSLKPVVNNSFNTVISSPGFLKFLPRSDKYLTGHNVNSEKLLSEKPSELLKHFKHPLKICSIGAFRSLTENKLLLKYIGNNSDYLIKYHGLGPKSAALMKHVVKYNYSNVVISLKYEKTEEKLFYQDCDMINLLEYPDKYAKYALPNRLYNAAIFGRPVIVFDGSFLAETVSIYGIGYVLNPRQSLSTQIKAFVNSYDYSTYNIGRTRFLDQVLKDNLMFVDALDSFII